MYSPDVMQAYIELYEASLTKLAEQYGTSKEEYPANSKEEKSDGSSQR